MAELDELLGEADRQLAERIAARILDGLRGNVVPAVIPAKVASQLREDCPNGSWGDFWIPAGNTSLMFKYGILADGSICLQLHDWNHVLFWDGKLRPANLPET